MKTYQKILITIFTWVLAIGIMLLEHYDLLFWVSGESKGVVEMANFPLAWFITKKVWNITIRFTKESIKQ